jgi:hypothetical protein
MECLPSALWVHAHTHTHTQLVCACQPHSLFHVIFARLDPLAHRFDVFGHELGRRSTANIAARGHAACATEGGKAGESE